MPTGVGIFTIPPNLYHGRLFSRYLSASPAADALFLPPLVSRCHTEALPREAPRDQLVGSSSAHGNLRTMIATRNYDTAVEDLNQLQSNATVLDAIRLSGGKLNDRSLPEMRDHCRRIGYEPADFDRLKPIHVTGTKGKGSTCAITESILRRYPKPGGNGLTLRTGLYTSPHLMEVRERIRIDGALLSKDKFTKYFYEVWDKWNDLDGQQASGPPAENMPKPENPRPGYFRFLTLVAFHAFIQEKVDVAVVEVGVGGRYDATNVLVHPVVCGVTSLGLDHCSVLGKSVAEIAWHKSGIFKEGVPAVTCVQSDEGMEVLKNQSKELKAPFFEALPISEYSNAPPIGLAGEHQKANAAVALALAREWVERYEASQSAFRSWPDQKTIPDYAIRGLRDVQWPGRAHKLQGPPSNTVWFMDGAHTVESVQACADWFFGQATEKDRSRKVRRILLFNCTSGRDTYNLLAPLARYHWHAEECTRFDVVLFCSNVTYASNTYKADLQNNLVGRDDQLTAQRTMARAWANLLAGAPNVSADSEPPLTSDPLPAGVHVLPTVEHAVNFVKDYASRASSARVEALVTGSLYLVGGVMTVLNVAL